MSAIMIFHSTIKDPESFNEYGKSVPATLEPFGGTVIAKGRKEKVFTGGHQHLTVGVLRFPDLEKAHQWYESEAYQNLVPVRDTAASMTVVSYEEPVG